MANTFLYANNVYIGISQAEKDLSEKAVAIQTKANNCNCNLILPIDVVCSNSINDINNNINNRC